jgi:hypothetical protein
MRAVWYDRQGTADEVLVCGELPAPTAAAHKAVEAGGKVGTVVVEPQR